MPRNRALGNNDSSLGSITFDTRPCGESLNIEIMDTHFGLYCNAESYYGNSCSAPNYFLFLFFLPAPTTVDLHGFPEHHTIG